MVVRIGGRRMYLWRAVDDEGEVLDVLVQKRRNKHAALKLLRKLLKNQGINPETITSSMKPKVPLARGVPDSALRRGKRLSAHRDFAAATGLRDSMLEGSRRSTERPRVQLDCTRTFGLGADQISPDPSMVLTS
jgi:transposase-like protein